MTIGGPFKQVDALEAVVSDVGGEVTRAVRLEFSAQVRMIKKLRLPTYRAKLSSLFIGQR